MPSCKGPRRPTPRLTRSAVRSNGSAESAAQSPARRSLWFSFAGLRGQIPPVVDLNQGTSFVTTLPFLIASRSHIGRRLEIKLEEVAWWRVFGILPTGHLVFSQSEP